MSRTLIHRLAVLTLAATLLAAAPASASPGFGEWRGDGFAEWLQQSWSWLFGWWGGGQEKLRCGIDPDGAPCVPEPTTAGDHGCEIDPNGGGCMPAATAKLRCDIDPDGCVQPVYAPEPDLGCGIDPDGGPCVPKT